MFCALEEKPPSDSEVALHITICDTDVGMEQDFLQEIFKPYVQADAVPQGIGMGAGLDIPKLTEAIQKFRTTPHRQRRAGGVNKHPLPCTKARQGVFVLGLFRGDRAGERLPLFRG